MNIQQDRQPRSKSLLRWLKTYTGQKYFTTCLFLLAPVLLLVLFTAIPALNMVSYSFQERDQFGLNARWVGLDNYKAVFTQSDILMPLMTSVYYMAGAVVQIVVALLIANILCTKIRWANFFKGVIFFPYMMNGIEVAIIFRRFFYASDGVINKYEGILNSIIQLFGGEPRIWLSASPVLANICMVFVSNWRYIGFNIIMFIGAIQSINPEIFEAANLDGAGEGQQFRYIIFPSIRPIVTLQMVLAIRGAISVYEIPYVIAQGRNGTESFVMKSVDTAFKMQRFGLASAMGIVLLLIIIFATVLQRLVLKEGDD
ncbi:MAG: sugar ABC transporter permease [Treponema sp.]|nr:sugar ABC transporter permease [Treponema sp.]